MRTTTAAALALISLIAAPAAANARVAATTISPEGVATTLPAFEGTTWKAKPITATQPPQNPYMAANPNSGLHNDSWMTDTYWRSGPSGKSPVTMSNSFQADLPGLCASITFNSKGQIVTICPNLFGPKLRLIDPTTLDLLAEQQLPAKECAAQVSDPGNLCVSGNIFQDFSGGGYFYLDNQDRAVVGANDRKIKIYAVNSAGDGFVLANSFDLSSVVPQYERFSSVLPDWQGRLWFVTKPGKVGYVEPTTGAIRFTDLHEQIQNSFTIDSTGVYVPTDNALYKFNSTAGNVKQLWRTVYPNIGVKKPGQAAPGTGTTPTILPGGLVSITDNADPMDIVVYKTTTGAQTCKVPVFSKGASATENSLNGAGTTKLGMLFVENNYGYDQPVSVFDGHTSKPGFTRVDVTNSGKTCKVKWRNTTDSAPSVVPKLSVANGLLYTFTKPATTNKADAWYWTAIDAATGKRVWRQLAGVGISKHNNNYAGIAISPTGALYLGLLGGVASMRDGS